MSVGPTGVRLGRGAATRWSKGAEERFLEELTASANVARAAAAAGFSAAAIYRRKVRDKHFSDGWEAAIAVGRARLEAHLLVAAERSFDPEAMPVAEGAPKVSVTEAISILKHKPAGAAATGRAPDWEEQSAIGEADYEAAQTRIIGRLKRLGERTDREKAEAGWTRHGDHWIPPGWVKTGG